MHSQKRPIKRIACIGEVMIELIAGAGNSAQIGVAGDTFNTSHYIAQIAGAREISVSYVTALGTDSFSKRIEAAMEVSGIDTEFVERRDDMMPGLYAIETDDQGERSFSYWRSASAARTLFQSPCEVTLDSLRQFDLILLSGITLAILPPTTRQNLLNWIDEYRTQGGTLAYDSNHRPRLWESTSVAQEINAQMWCRTDIALPSVDDEMALFGDTDEAAVLARLSSYGITAGALKRGADGPLDLASLQALPKCQPVTNVVDSTAAGDSFNAGYLAAYAADEDDLTALLWGHKLACHVVTQPGAIVPVQDTLLA